MRLVCDAQYLLYIFEKMMSLIVAEWYDVADGWMILKQWSYVFIQDKINTRIRKTIVQRFQ